MIIMPLDWKRIKAICFDVDGTLSDTDNHMVASLVNSLQGLRWLIPEDFLTRAARMMIMAGESPGNFIYNLADRLGLDRVVIHMSDWLNRHALRRKPETFWIIPGVKELLEKLNPRFPLAVVSARGRVGTETFL